MDLSHILLHGDLGILCLLYGSDYCLCTLYHVGGLLSTGMVSDFFQTEEY